MAYHHGNQDIYSYGDSLLSFLAPLGVKASASTKTCLFMWNKNVLADGLVPLGATTSTVSSVIWFCSVPTEGLVLLDVLGNSVQLLIGQIRKPKHSQLN